MGLGCLARPCWMLYGERGGGDTCRCPCMEMEAMGPPRSLHGAAAARAEYDPTRALGGAMWLRAAAWSDCEAQKVWLGGWPHGLWGPSRVHPALVFIPS